MHCSSDLLRNAKVKYTFSINKQESGVVYRSGTMEVTNNGPSPAITIAIGSTFTVPGIGEVVYTKTSDGITVSASGYTARCSVIVSSEPLMLSEIGRAHV